MLGLDSMAKVKVNFNHMSGKGLQEDEKVVIQDKKLTFQVMTGITI